MPTYEKIESLSDDRPAQVRHLLLFELDDLPKDVPDDYTYRVELVGGDSFLAYFDFSETRIKPSGNPELAKEGTPEFYAWREYLRQEEGRKHQLAKYDAYAEYLKQVREYIKEKCLDEETRERIKIPEDWIKLYRGAFANLVSQEDITRAMRDNFRR